MARLSEAERATRHEGMGATDILEVALYEAGEVPWEDAGPMRVYCRKLGLMPEEAPTPEQEWGHVQEDLLLREYERQIGEAILPAGHVPGPSDDGFPWWATLDGKVISRSCLVEAKNVGRFMCYGWDDREPDGIPHHVRAQVTLGMRALRLSCADVIASLGGMPPKIWRVEYDVELAGMLIASGRKFWHEHVIPRVPPKLDDSNATLIYLRSKYPKEEQPKRKATPEEQEIAVEAICYLNARKDADALYGARVAALLEKCGPAEGLKGDGWSLSWKLHEASGERRGRFTPARGKGAAVE